MEEQLNELARRREAALGMGGPDRIARQHALGRLTARERIDLLLDPDSFVEIGQLAWASEEHRQAPADGVVTGHGKMDGRVVSIVAEDFTVLGGSWGHAGKRKTGLTSDMALAKGNPFIWLADGSGGRVQEEMGSHILGEGSRVFDVMVQMTGVVPRAAAVMGPAFGISGFMAALADFIVMVRGSAWGMSGPPVVRMAIGEEVTAEEIGGADVHSQITGQADRIAKDDRECLALLREFLSFMPSSSREAPQRTAFDDPADRTEDKLLRIIPESPNQAYDMREIIACISDDGKFFPFKPDYGLNLITGLARMGGRTIGIMANQPQFLGGALDARASDKGTRLARLCGRFHIPMVYLIDTPGFLVGKDVEREASLSRAMDFLQALNDAKVPKIALFIRKGYGLGFHVMAGINPDIKVAWPSAQVGIMGPEAGVEVIHRKRLAEADDPTALRGQLLEDWRAQLAPWGAATRAFIGDVIDPRETRPFLIRALDIVCG